MSASRAAGLPLLAAAYLFKLESPQNRAQVATDWLLGVFFRPAVTQIRDLIEEERREPDEARSPEATELDGRRETPVEERTE